MISIGAFLAVFLLILGIFLYRKKKQYDFIFKMHKAAKKQEELAKKQEEFEQKREQLSQTEGENIVIGLGGKNNILSKHQCAIRIRVEVIEQQLVNDKLLKQAGVSGVIKNGTVIHLIVGDRAAQIYKNIEVSD